MDDKTMKVLKWVGGSAAGVVGTGALLRRAFPYIFRDLGSIRGFVQATKAKQALMDRGVVSIVDLFEESAARLGQRTYIIYEGVEYSWAEVDAAANRTARCLTKLGFRRGDCVAMFMHNSPAFMWTLFGLMKIGVICALINTNLTHHSLLHCVKAADAKAVIVDYERDLQQAMLDIQGDLGDVQLFALGDPSSLSLPFISWDIAMMGVSAAPLEGKPRAGMTSKDTLAYIYTSGTTGLPKPAIITGDKFFGGCLFTKLMGVSKDDVNYVTLPLYHSSALLLGVCPAALIGYKVALRRKFSATHFWEDVRRYHVTSFLYIGELCRFLVNRPKTPDDLQHNVRMIYGNGLRVDVWRQMKERFNVPDIREFYAATEGGFGLLNKWNRVGCIGHMTPWLIGRAVKLVQYDMDSEKPVRDKQGFCQVVNLGEAGLLVVPINDQVPFYGYHGKKELTDKKILRDVFVKGDMYFNSGDLLIQDKEYFVYFHDRIGDTFRWRGENVATTEVANAVSQLPFIADVCVYGVHVHGQEGKAGMASIILRQQDPPSPVEMQKIYDRAVEELPTYARPVFLRFPKDIQLTGTFKQTKANLVKEGFDPSAVADPLYHLTGKGYQRLTTADYDRLYAKRPASKL